MDPVVDALDDRRVETAEVVRRSRSGVVVAGLAVIAAAVAFGLATLPDDVDWVDEPPEDATFEAEPAPEPIERAEVVVVDEPWDWEPLPLPDDATGVHLDGDVVLAWSSTGTSRLWRLGDTWSPVDLPVDTIQITRPRDGVLATSTETGELFVTTDLGGNWQVVDLPDLPASTSLVRHHRVVLGAVRQADSLVIYFQHWQQFDADGYLELIGESLRGDEVAAVLDPSARRVELVTFGGQTSRSFDLDAALLTPEAELAIELAWQPPPFRLIRVDPMTGGVIADVEPPELDGPPVELDVIDDRLLVRIWNGDTHMRTQQGWERRADQPSHGTIGGVSIDVTNGRLRLSTDEQRIDWPGTGLGYAQGSANPAGAVFVTEATDVPPPIAEVAVDEGSIEFGLRCCVTLTTELGTLTHRVWEGEFPGEIVETADGWTISTESTRALTLTRQQWSSVADDLERQLADIPGIQMLATADGRLWSLSPIHDALGAVPSFASAEVGATRAIVFGRALPSDPVQLINGHGGETLAWIAEIPG